MFQGFSQDAVDFLWGVKFNNNREWFTAHKEEYLTLLDRPLRELSQQLLDAMCEAYPHEDLVRHVSRIYRDARRLHGRGPYKENLWFIIARPGEGMIARPAFYFEIAPNCWGCGCGYWDMTPELAAKHRARIDRDPKPLEKIARQIEKSKFTLFGAEYKRPKGDPGKLLAPWYNRRNLGVSFEDNCEGVLFTPALYDELLEAFRFLMPLYRYLDSLPGDPPPKEAT